MSKTALDQALDCFAGKDEMGGFISVGAELFPDWTPGRKCRAPHRPDASPSFSVSQNSDGQWRFKDFATGERGGLLGFVMLAGMNARQAAQWMRSRAGLSHTSPMPVKNDLTRSRPIPSALPPYRLSETELIRCKNMAEDLLRDEAVIQSIAASRKWCPKVIQGLAQDPALGLHDGKLVYIYPTGAKKRFRPLAHECGGDFRGAPFTWLFGKPDSLWRAHLLQVATKVVHITEGETAAISLVHAGIDNGVTELVMAAPSASCWRDEWALMLAGREVVIWPDSDAAGEKLKQRIIKSCAPFVESIEVALVARGGGI